MLSGSGSGCAVCSGAPVCCSGPASLSFALWPGYRRGSPALSVRPCSPGNPTVPIRRPGPPHPPTTPTPDIAFVVWVRLQRHCVVSFANVSVWRIPREPQSDIVKCGQPLQQRASRPFCSIQLRDHLPITNADGNLDQMQWQTSEPQMLRPGSFGGMKVLLKMYTRSEAVCFGLGIRGSKVGTCSCISFCGWDLTLPEVNIYYYWLTLFGIPSRPTRPRMQLVVVAKSLGGEGGTMHPLQNFCAQAGKVCMIPAVWDILGFEKLSSQRSI